MRRSIIHLAAAAVLGLIALAPSALAASAASAASAPTEPTEVTARFPAGTVKQDAAKTIVGTVSGAPGRVVRIESKGDNGTWVPLASTTTDERGSFSVAAPTWWVARQRLRAYAPATGTDQAGASATGSYTVSRNDEPLAGTAFESEFPVGIRWEPCSGPLTYRINPHLMWPGGKAAVRSALAQVSAATGLRFAYQGTTRFVPLSHYPQANPRGVDLAIGWSRAGALPAWVLGGNTVGRTDIYWNTWTDGAGGTGFELGASIALEIGRWDDRYTSKQRRAAHANLLLHEIGHAMGLDHVEDRRQIMSPGVTTVARYGGGDLRGLAALGAGRGCAGSGAEVRARTARGYPTSTGGLVADRR